MNKITCKKCGTKAEITTVDFRCLHCGERICAKCGCTDTAACDPPCYWSKPGECSNCYFAVAEPSDPLDARVVTEPDAEDEFFDSASGETTAPYFSIEQLEKIAFYFPPHWRNETSGILKKAVKSYSLHVSRGEPPPTGEQIKLIHRYFRAYIFAPVWESVAVSDDAFDTTWTLKRLGELRRRADVEFKTCRDIGDFLTRCAAVGFDPL